LTIIEFEEKIIGEDETLLILIFILVFFAVHFCEAWATSDRAAIVEFLPVVNDAFLEHEEEDDKEVYNSENSNMNLAQSLLAEVLGVISEPWRDYLRLENRLIRENDQTKESMYKHCKWKQFYNASG